tara:strand:+ start:556 stop:999 length:444 start_codon:yes stop_codon:yes gene_type:complete
VAIFSSEKKLGVSIKTLSGNKEGSMIQNDVMAELGAQIKPGLGILATKKLVLQVSPVPGMTITDKNLRLEVVDVDQTNGDGGEGFMARVHLEFSGDWKQTLQDSSNPELMIEALQDRGWEVETGADEDDEESEDEGVPRVLYSEPYC